MRGKRIAFVILFLGLLAEAEAKSPDGLRNKKNGRNVEAAFNEFVVESEQLKRSPQLFARCLTVVRFSPPLPGAPVMTVTHLARPAYLRVSSRTRQVSLFHQVSRQIALRWGAYLWGPIRDNGGELSRTIYVQSSFFHGYRPELAFGEFMRLLGYYQSGGYLRITLSCQGPLPKPTPTPAVVAREVSETPEFTPDGGAEEFFPYETLQDEEAER
ncbi:hypothetical protein HY628_03220 [Candidatus Uhrbacteria bacterium]|nr:hypothetical protein [Candidatus Uhrbacteria bacterium]